MKLVRAIVGIIGVMFLIQALAAWAAGVDVKNLRVSPEAKGTEAGPLCGIGK